MSSLVGQSLGRYRILEQLGEGGMAVVYKAFDTHLKTKVAVKAILPARQQSEKMLVRFEREAKALEQLSHPNIVEVLDYGKKDGIPYLVMELVTGGTLKSRLGKPLPWQQAVDLLVPIAHALKYAHEHNIIHRDVKPSNILLTQDGRPKLSDFGVAKILYPEDAVNLTGTNTMIGTPAYMAPEQVNSRDVDARTDVYALGVVLYEMITGRKPFTANTPVGVLVKSMSEPLPKPSRYVPGLPEAIEEVLLIALAKNPQDRFSNMDVFSAVMERLLAGKKLEISPRLGLHLDSEETIDQETFDTFQPINVQGLSSRKPDVSRFSPPKLDRFLNGIITCPFCKQETPANSWVCIKCGRNLGSVALVIRKGKRE